MRPATRVLLAVAGLAAWGAGLWWFASGDYVGGGAAILAGGLLLVVAASGGWSQFGEAVANWLFFWR